MFRRLNTGGVRLNPQELRNALYPGLFNKALHDLSRDDIFTEIWRIPKRRPDEEENPSADLQKNTLYKSMMDCELVLRFFAIREAVAGKVKGSLRQIFDKTMLRYGAFDEEQINLLKAEFLGTLERITTALGTDFHLLPGDQPSRPLYDAILVATEANPNIDLEANAQAIRTRLNSSLHNADNYDILVGRGNTLESIKDRVELATLILAGQ